MLYMETLEEGTVCGLVTLTHREQVFKDGRSKGYWWVGTCSCGTTVGPYTAAHWKKKIRACKKCGYGNRKANRIGGTHNAASSVYRNYKTSAAKRKLEFALTFEDFVSEATKPCFYCNRTETSYFSATQEWEETFRYTGLDRVDSSVGYLLRNVVPCCKVCNMAKSSMTVQEFYDWIVALGSNVENIVSLLEWEMES